MSLNCLRINANAEDGEESKMNDGQDKKKPNLKMSSRRADRSWSGNLAPNFRPKSNFRRMRSRSTMSPASKSQKAHPIFYRVHNSGPLSYESAPTTPRLVRSSGMRRDWSFEDLRRALEG
ncbi:hypothetical protein BUALT_Bualt10G0014300 [Buddleja alternifolia]|uniref:Uncharacterized protein n=1 Tax=Buddleja alternifolia TaxID=168488 RepID=A0AAV6WWZ9_9LAMI|nr:hypothetical protein BUALT_Bualt10G0014300 [Buddleja alternifolia]